MTFREISRKLRKNNRRQYALFFCSVLFSISMTGAYGVLQYSRTITDVLIDGGSTQTISQAMFSGSMFGILVFLVYADALFLKYRSQEIGMFLSLGIDRCSVQRLMLTEFTVLFWGAALTGLLLAVPAAFLCWTALSVFLKTTETVFVIGWGGLAITFVFAALSWLVLWAANRRYIRTVDILKIIKHSDENESVKNGTLSRLILGCALIPAGIMAFFMLQDRGGFLNTFLSFASLAGAMFGVFTLILQCASIGDVLKVYRVRAYYRNLVFYNLMKQKIRQYTRSVFVATLLITFTIFGIGFSAAGFVNGYHAALDEPYDYTISTSADRPEVTEERILEIAEETDTTVTELVRFDSLLLGAQHTYRDGFTDWGSQVVVSERTFRGLGGRELVVPEGSYTLYSDCSMQYKKNAFWGDGGLLYNPTTGEERFFRKNESVCMDGLVNSRFFFSSFLILNDEDYADIEAELAEEYKATTFMVNVENWRETGAFQERILEEIVSDHGGEIFTNWHNSAVFDKTGSRAEYLLYAGNEIRVARVWALYPLSKLSSTTTQVQAFAVYLLLMLFIAIVTFVSSIMVVGIKVISTMWDDADVYEHLCRLGMRRREIGRLITMQMGFVYLIPTVLGCLMGAFATYRIMLVSGIVYVWETMCVVGAACGLVMVLQAGIFAGMRGWIGRKAGMRFS